MSWNFVCCAVGSMFRFDENMSYGMKIIDHIYMFAEWGSLTRLMLSGINLKGISGAVQRAVSSISLMHVVILNR